MGRKKVEPKTPLAKRLTAVREHLEFEERELFANELDISLAMLGYYERGDRIPDATVLAEYHNKFGVNLSWLIAGSGSMFDGHSRTGDAGKLPRNTQSFIDFIAVLGRLLNRLYKETGVHVTSDQRVQLLVDRTKQVLDRYPSMEWNRYMDALPTLEAEIREELMKKATSPEDSKRQA